MAIYNQRRVWFAVAKTSLKSSKSANSPARNGISRYLAVLCLFLPMMALEVR